MSMIVHGSGSGQFLRSPSPLRLAMEHFLARARGPRQSHDPGEIHGLALVIGSQYREMRVGDDLTIPVVKPTRWISWTVDTDPPFGTVAIKMEYASLPDSGERNWLDAMAGTHMVVTVDGVAYGNAPAGSSAIREWNQKDVIRLTVVAVGNNVERATIGLYVYELPNPAIHSDYVSNSLGDLVTDNSGAPLSADEP